MTTLLSDFEILLNPELTIKLLIACSKNKIIYQSSYTN